jgi:hypothetical protein
MTRRVVKPQPDDDGLHDHTHFPMSLDSDLEGWWGTVAETGESRQYHPYQIGDRLWVRETFTKAPNGDYIYRADPIFDGCGKGDISWGWTPSIFMPRKAARIFLEVKAVRIERLQEITPKDCYAEGILFVPQDIGGEEFSRQVEDDWALFKFQNLWDTLNSRRGYSWDSNPYVYVYEFMRVK